MTEPAVFVFVDGGVMVYSDAYEAASLTSSAAAQRLGTVAYDETGRQLDIDMSDGMVHFAPTHKLDLAELVARLREAVRPRALVEDPSKFADAMLLRRPPPYEDLPIRLQQLDDKSRSYRLCTPGTPAEGWWICQVVTSRQFHRELSRVGIDDVREIDETEHEAMVARREWGPTDGYAAVVPSYGQFRVRGPIDAGSVPCEWPRRDRILATQLDMLSLTVQTLLHEGVAAGTQLKVDFTFSSPTQESAEQLRAALPSDVVDVSIGKVHKGLLRRRVVAWRVTGSDRVELVEPALEAWIIRMVHLGSDHSAELDGWGAVVPETKLH